MTREQIINSFCVLLYADYGISIVNCEGAKYLLLGQRELSKSNWNPVQILSDKISNHLDSLEHVQLIVDCENTFDIKIPDEKAEETETFLDIIDLICNAKAIAI